ncbi:hypothetical protein L6E12_32305 [Actinokineospora sp. PR83]|uniref:hypothetical protein n=1 Tax=Actinokineospora sp. PR83 TaxID=2884908 RepID=UPI001F45E9FC|nr:hypothetical protein [Actinokineospora sp. PR83]MCG8920460.1 hypothetical protein [Actinokineospora sp. PR83]
MGADVRPGLDALVRGLAGNADVKRIQEEQVEGAVLTLMGAGKTTAIRVNGKHMELHVLSEPLWDGLTLKEKKAEAAKTDGADGATAKTDDGAAKTEDAKEYGKAKPTAKIESTNEQKSENARDGVARVQASVTAIPPMFAGAGLDLPAAPSAAHEHKSTYKATQSSTVELKALEDVEVPVKITYTLFDASGARVGAVQSVTGKVGLSVPTTLQQESTAGPFVAPTNAMPRRFAVETAHAKTEGGKSFFDQAKGLFPKQLMAVGADGRTALREMFSEATLTDKVIPNAVSDPTAVGKDEGWVRADQILHKGKHSKSWSQAVDQVEVRAVTRYVQVIEQPKDVKHTDTDALDIGSGDKHTTSRTIGGIAFFGWGVDTPAFFVGGGPTGGFSFSKENSQNITHNNVAKETLSTTGDAVRYRAVYDLQIRRVGHDPVPLAGHVEAVQWTRRDRAERAGMVSDDTTTGTTPNTATPNTAKPNADTANADTANASTTPDTTPAPAAPTPPRVHYGPAHMESKLSLGGAKINELYDNGHIREKVAELLQKTPGHRWYHLSSRKFLRTFDSPDLAKWNTTQNRVNELLARGDDLATKLTSAQLSELVDTMISPNGLTMEIVKKGVFREYHAVITLRAKLTDFTDVPGKAVNEAESGSTAKSKSEVEFGKGKKKTFAFGGQARVQGPVGNAFGVYIAEVKGTQTRSATDKLSVGDKGSVVRTDGDALKADGTVDTRKFHKFRGTLEISQEVRSYNRLNERTRAITFGSRGRTVPEVETLGASTASTPVAPHVVPLEVFVPDKLVSTTQPAPLTITPTNQQVTNRPPAIDNLLVPDSHVFDNAEIVAVLGSENAVKSVEDSMARASGNDPAFTFADGARIRMIQSKLSPDAMKHNPTLFSEVTKIEGIGHGRRLADGHGRAGVVFTPTAARKLGPVEFQKIQERTGNRTTTGSGRGTDNGFGATSTGVAVVSGTGTTAAPGNTVSPRGIFIADFTPLSARWGSKEGGEVTSVERTVYEHGVPVKKSLVAVDLDVAVVAEVHHRDNLLHRFSKPDPAAIGKSGESFHLDNAVLMWATDAQIARMNGEPAPAPAALSQHGDRTLPSPATLVDSAKPSIGIGRVTTPIDLRSILPQVRSQLGTELAARLLPDSALAENHHNVRALSEFLAHADRSVNSTLNGGRSVPVRLEDRLSGKTYYATLKSNFQGTLTFAGIDHVNQTTAAAKTTIKNTSDRSQGVTIASVNGSVRPGMGITKQGDPANAGKTTGFGEPSGALTAGPDAGADLGKFDRKTSVEQQVDHKQSATAAGPMAAHRGPLSFDLVIEREVEVDASGQERANETLVSVKGTTEDVTVVKLAEDSLPARTAGKATYGEADPVTPVTDKAQHTADGLAAWHRGGHKTGLPPEGTFFVEHFLGDVADLRRGAEKAIEGGGAKVDAATVASLRSGLNVVAAKVGVGAMDKGKFVVPLPSHLKGELEVHVRFPDPPRLASASAAVEVKGSEKAGRKVKVEFKSGNEYRTGATALAVGAGAGHPAGANSPSEGRRNFQSLFGATRKRLPISAKDLVGTTEVTKPAGSITTPQSPEAVKPDEKVTRADLRTAEFRFVFRPTGGLFSTLKTGAADVTVHDAYVIRSTPDATTALPKELVDAVTELKETGEAWNKAVVQLEGMRNALDEVLTPEAMEDGIAEVEKGKTAADEAAGKWWSAYDAYQTALAAARGENPAPAGTTTPDDGSSRADNDSDNGGNSADDAQRTADEERQRQADQAEADRKRAEEEAARRAEEKAAAKRAEEEAAAKRAEEEAAAKRAEEEAAAKRAEEEAAAKRAEEAAAKRAEEEAAAKRAEEAAAKRAEEEAAAKRAEEAAAKRAEEEAAAKRAEEAAAKRAEEEAAAKRAEEAAAKRAEEEAARRAEEKAAAKRAEEEAAKRAEEEAAAKRAEEAAAKRAEEEAAKRAEEEAAAKQAEEAAAKRVGEEAGAGQRVSDEAAEGEVPAGQRPVEESAAERASDAGSTGETPGGPAREDGAAARELAEERARFEAEQERVQQRIESESPGRRREVQEQLERQAERARQRQGGAEGSTSPGDRRQTAGQSSDSTPGTPSRTRSVPEPRTPVERGDSTSPRRGTPQGDATPETPTHRPVRTPSNAEAAARDLNGAIAEENATPAAGHLPNTTPESAVTDTANESAQVTRQGETPGTPRTPEAPAPDTVGEPAGTTAEASTAPESTRTDAEATPTPAESAQLGNQPAPEQSRASNGRESTPAGLSLVTPESANPSVVSSEQVNPSSAAPTRQVGNQPAPEQSRASNGQESTPATPEPITPDSATSTPATPEQANPSLATPEPANADSATPSLISPDPSSATRDLAGPDSATPNVVGPEQVNPSSAAPEQATSAPTRPGPVTPSSAGPRPSALNLATPGPLGTGPVTPGSVPTTAGATPANSPLDLAPAHSATNGARPPASDSTTRRNSAPVVAAEPAVGSANRSSSVPAPGSAAGGPAVRSVTLGDDDGGGSSTGGPQRLSDLGDFSRSWFDARLEFQRRAEEYEGRLADYLMRRADVQAEFGRFAQAVWGAVPQRRKRWVGENEPSLIGAVGVGTQNQQVVQSGNLRERITLIWSLARGEELLGALPDLHTRHPRIEGERPQRHPTDAVREITRLSEDTSLSRAERQRQIDELTRSILTRARPGDVYPPLSQRELSTGVRDGELRWIPANNRMEMALYVEPESSTAEAGPSTAEDGSSTSGDRPPIEPEQLGSGGGLHQQAEGTGGLVSTGTSGSTHLVLTLASMLNQHRGAGLNLDLLRLGLFGFLRSTDQHTYHEVMRAAEFVDPALLYDDNFGRYHRFGPLSEQELRDNVAVDGLFPDEHALALVDWDAARAVLPDLPEQSRHSDPFDLEDLAREFDAVSTGSRPSSSGSGSSHGNPFHLDPGTPPRARSAEQANQVSEAPARGPGSRTNPAPEQPAPRPTQAPPQAQPTPGQAVASSSRPQPTDQAAPSHGMDPAAYDVLYEEAMGIRPTAISPPEQTTVLFEKEQTQLNDQGRWQVQELAYGLFEDMRRRGPDEFPPRITIVGYGNSRTHATRTGEARARAVRDLLMDTMNAERERYARHGHDRAALPNPESFKPTVHSGGRSQNPRPDGPDLATRRRTVIIDVMALSDLLVLGGGRPGVEMATPDAAPTPDAPTQDAPSTTPAPGTLDNPVPLTELFAPGHVDLDDVVFTPLTDASGEVVGVAFPRAGEAGILADAFEHGAGDPGAYSVALHHSADGFAVQRKSDGKEVRIDEAGVLRLLASSALPGGQAWRQHSELVFLSCRVADPALGNRLGGLADLLREDGYRGAVRGPDSPVTLFDDGTRSFPDGGGLRTAGERLDVPGPLADSPAPTAERPGVVMEDEGAGPSRSTDDDADSVSAAVIDLWVAADEAHGEGVFDPPAPPAPQPHLAGQDHADLSAAEGAELIKRLDLTKPTPTHADLTPSALAEGPDSAVARSAAGERRYTWAGDRGLPPLPELLELPRLVHSVVLGGALRTAGAVAHFRDNLLHTARTAGERWKAVLWTDVSRGDIARAAMRWQVLGQARHGVSGEDDELDLDYLTNVADLYDLAAGAGIALLDVNEVFHDEAPMDQYDRFASELDRDTRESRDAAAAIAANEILSRFGGVHADPRLRADDLGPAEAVVHSPAGWAGGSGLLAVPKGHPIADLHRDALAGVSPVSAGVPSAPGVGPVEAPAAPEAPTAPVAGGLPGDDVLPDLARLAGLADAAELPGLAGFTPGDPGPADEPTAESLAGLPVDEAAKRVIEELVRDLRDRGGDLNLLAVADAIAGHPRAGELWTVVLAFLATRPELAELVRSVTLEGVDETGAPRRVVLPPRAAELIELAGDPVVSRPGEHSVAASLQWPDWL